jgi:TolB protein
MKKILLLLLLLLFAPVASGLMIVPVCTEEWEQTFPAVSGETIVWQDSRNQGGDPDIYMWHPKTGEQAVTTASSIQMYPEISGDTIVWQEGPPLYPDVWMWDPVNGTQPVATGGYELEPKISDDTIVWWDGLMGDTLNDIWMWDPKNGAQPVCTDPAMQSGPSISGDTIVWTDTRNSFPSWGSDIYKWDPVNGEQPVCTEEGDQRYPAISRNTIVWIDNRNGDWDIYRWVPKIGEQPVCTEPGDQGHPAISGDTIVWMDNRNSATTGWDIYMWDPVNGEQPVCTEEGDQRYPAISGDIIVWADNRNSATTGWDIYMADLSEVPPDACVLDAETSFVCMSESGSAFVDFTGAAHDYNGDLVALEFDFSQDPSQLNILLVPIDPPTDQFSANTSSYFYQTGRTEVTLTCRDGTGLEAEDAVTIFIANYTFCENWEEIYTSLTESSIDSNWLDKFSIEFSSAMEAETQDEQVRYLSALIKLAQKQMNKKVPEEDAVKIIQSVEDLMKLIDPQPWP